MNSLKNNHIVTIIDNRFVALCDVPLYKTPTIIRHSYSVAQRQCPSNTKNRFIVCVSVVSFPRQERLSHIKSPNANIYVYAFETLEDCSKYIMESVETHVLRDYATVYLERDNAIGQAIFSNFERNDKYKYNRNFIMSRLN